MEFISKNYNTIEKRKLKGSVPKSRVDWKRTKLDSSSDELSTFEEEIERNTEVSGCTGESTQKQSEILTPSAVNGEDYHTNKPKMHKSAMIIRSDSSSDSDGTIRKDKGGCNIDEDNENYEDKENNSLNKDTDPIEPRGMSYDGKTEAHMKKQRRSEKVSQLAEKRRAQSQTSIWEELNLRPLNANVKDDKKLGEVRELFKENDLFQFVCSDLASHLRKVIRALLNNIADNNFLKSLYERIELDKHAADLLNSLNCFDHIIEDHLQKLTTTCYWSSSYKNRIGNYPNIEIQEKEPVKRKCDACKLLRTCRFPKTLSGRAYNLKTLKNDEFLENNKLVLFVGIVCFELTKLYHKLRHYKYHLYQRCISLFYKFETVSTKELVDIVLSKMEKEKFIETELLLLEGYLKEAEKFQTETKDALLS